MLVLSRNIDQDIRIGEDVVIRILEVRGGQVRIGIDAPKHISVHREEIFQKIQNEKESGGAA